MTKEFIRALAALFDYTSLLVSTVEAETKLAYEF
jgi:hypothetical protein